MARGGMSGKNSRFGGSGRFLRAFKKGGTVKKTGPAVVHKDEIVIPAKKAKKPAVKKAIKKAVKTKAKK
jgi:hypothetical protein